MYNLFLRCLGKVDIFVRKHFGQKQLPVILRHFSSSVVLPSRLLWSVSSNLHVS